MIVDNKIVGVAGTTIPMKIVDDLFVGAQLGKTGDTYLINQQGYFITPFRVSQKNVHIRIAVS